MSLERTNFISSLLSFHSFLLSSQRYRFQCPRCKHRSTRFYRMRTHAASLHGIAHGSAQMNKFLRECRQLSKAGIRKTSRARILKLMGRYAASRSHYLVARKVLQGHLFMTKAFSNDDPKGGKPSKPVSRPRHTTPPPTSTPVARQRRSVIKDTGILPEISEEMLCQPARVFKEVELARAKRSPQGTLATAKMVHRYVNWSQRRQPFQSDAVILLSTELPMDFMHEMSAIFRPNTLKNHAGAMIAFLDQAQYQREIKKLFGSSPSVRQKLAAVREVWTRLKQRHEREARHVQREAVRGGQLRNAPVKLMCDFLIANSALSDLHTELLPSERSTADCVVATVLALHGQRLCAALNLTAGEVLDAAPVHGNSRIIRVQDHKTRRSHGPAAICLREREYRLFRSLARQRATLAGRSAPLLTAPAGKGCQTLFSPLNEYITRELPDWQGLTFNLVRKTIESNVHLAPCSSRHVAGTQVNAYLLHGKEVTALYYAYRSDTQVAAEALAVQSILTALVVLDLVRDGQLQLPGHWRGESSL